MKKSIPFLVAGCMFVATAAHAATVTLSEGVRAPILGSIDLGDVKGSARGAYFAGDFGTGDTLRIHGRVVHKRDTFAFTMDTGFDVSFLFGGYETENGTTRGSGFTSAGRKMNTSVFRLFDALTGVEVAAKTFSSGITSSSDTGGNALIFSAGPGDYLFQIDGAAYDNRRAAALYDIEISAVPLPASSLMLLAGVGALGMARRRKLRN